MNSHLQEIDFVSLADMDDGKLNMVLRKHLKRASEDCQDRPADQKPRKVVIEIGYVPLLEPQGDATDSWMQVKIRSNIPDHVSKPYSVGMRRNGTFVFNNNSLNNVNQNTIDFDGEDA